MLTDINQWAAMVEKAQAERDKYRAALESSLEYLRNCRCQSVRQAVEKLEEVLK